MGLSQIQSFTMLAIVGLLYYCMKMHPNIKLFLFADYYFYYTACIRNKFITLTALPQLWKSMAQKKWSNIVFTFCSVCSHLIVNLQHMQ